jgi:thiol-disulfide isomerase/thioredoxin
MTNIKMNWKIPICTLLIITSFSIKSQTLSKLEVKHEQFKKAWSTLKVFKQSIANNNDTAILIQEMKRLQTWYLHIADSLKTIENQKLYPRFAVQRYINLAYQSENLNQLQQYKDSLLFLMTKHYDQINSSPILHEINNCFVYASEVVKMSGTKYDSIIISDIQNRITALGTIYSDSINLKSKEIINRFADLYYERSMVSMAALIYKHFNNYFYENTSGSSPFLLSRDYSIFDKNSGYIAKMNDKPFWKVMVFNQTSSTYHKTNIINIRRKLFEVNPAIPLIIGRDSSMLDMGSITEMGRQIAGNLYYINLNNNDANYLKNTANYVMLTPDNKISYSSNNPSDFLDWIENLKPKTIAKKPSGKKNTETEPYTKERNISTSFDNYTINLKGDWPEDAAISVRSYYYTKETEQNKIIPKEHALNNIQIVQGKHTIYNQYYISNSNEKNHISITADDNFFITTTFSDIENTNYQKNRQKLTELFTKTTAYKFVLDDYPFKNGEFYLFIKSRVEQLNKLTDQYISDSIAEADLRSLLAAEIIAARLNITEKPVDVSYKDFKKMMPEEYISEIVYHSPFYKQIIDGWLSYISKSGEYETDNMRKGIDMLFGSALWMPNEAIYNVGQYIWKQMNARGREDIMKHIDTTYLTACGAENIDVAKRLKGYKRMAKGNKSPNIVWQENGKPIQLYDLQADTVYVIFWADWCMHCQDVLLRLYKKTTSNNNVKVVAVNIDNDNSSTTLGKRLMPLWHHIQATGQWDDDLIEQYNVFGTPTIYVLDNKFKILRRFCQ